MVSLVEQELIILLDHMTLLPFLVVRFPLLDLRFSIECVFHRPLFVILSVFYFGHCVVCSSKYDSWLPLWHLQTFRSKLFSLILMTSIYLSVVTSYTLILWFLHHTLSKSVVYSVPKTSFYMYVRQCSTVTTICQVKLKPKYYFV
jgi:hypothetical protein